ncbi:phosphoribosylaminoimidazolesuccinocarboxamide synthase [Nanchangia anserum]|uniref:Phosphoribosylaminoimidazole-succinocarboxamide synthase n=1 Tax=Nanchangia anserum TaxID=2692125 RepID=A0A8I0GC21_9ACTO|nr:phosphoribosylaminoimidazolesuccinocarboxamide synthase [Nanchangia anserum]MBD3689521.1 phosphoribosylaminoimidazolesuccinocarboxamide synthase [Nanchangia anserum]QOX81711.1 phosphoribosylaminoimidazolesuccinocarboxamide synthase [Nanchangia anserum]
MATSQAPALRGWRHLSGGKVRELYIPAGVSPHEAETVLIVATDRISAFDQILPTTIPGKGVVLTQMSLWWFDQLKDIVPNHVVSTEVPDQVAGRAMICRRLDMYPLECVVRGYLTGSGKADYDETGEVCGISLPEGLVEASELEQPIFTPAAKMNMGKHDINVTLADVDKMVGPERTAELRETSLRIYERAAQIARDAGIILADTKLEFGSLVSVGGPAVVLGDEALTPDSSRFWPVDQWHPGSPTPSFDKQLVRDWLKSDESGWDPASGTTPPPLPDEIVERTSNRYVEAYEMLTGQTINL